VLHGLAGAVPALALFPIAAMESPWLMVAYLGVFGLGVMLGMAGYCLVLGGLIRTFSDALLERWVQPVIGTSSCALGVVWMIRTGLLVP
ncbi:MAG: hypothetical protein O7E51_16135, partial [Acidobacteria bacterium]|nr:hypothetical protein [Acidobacteriota bacterium]